ncbi:DNA primase TraC [Halioglobus japonicus]|nr:DNA primase TraC [Halioglobus japonicus]
MSNQSIHQKITDQIIEAMKNAKDFQLPWNAPGLGLPTNSFTRNTYNGINILSLWVSAMDKQFSSNSWATYKQWQQMGAQVRKGQKGNPIVIYKALSPNEDTGSATETGPDYHTRPRVLIRSATVFNADQVTGLEIPQPQLELGENKPLDRLGLVDTFVSNTQAVIKVGGSSAYYSPKQDLIAIPNPECFIGTDTSSRAESWYSALLHELTHWTGNDKRCHRNMSGRFGDESYAIEELIAELGAAFLCAQLNVTSVPRQDHADYLANWIKVLSGDVKAIFWASARASEAVAYLNGLQPTQTISSLRTSAGINNPSNQVDPA